MITKHKYLSFLGLLLMQFYALAQNEANIWHFGSGLALDFNRGEPVVLSESSIQSFSGAASISDESGNLLFYTNGEKVWDREHQIMPGGEMLVKRSGRCFIIKKPGEKSGYYIIRQDYLSGPPFVQFLSYFEVDMELNGGKGQVTQNNIPITSFNTYNKFLVVGDKANQKNWLVAFKVLTDSVFSYEITDEGINGEPVVSTTAVVSHDGLTISDVSYLKASVDGRKLSTNLVSGLYVFDFDTNNGMVSNAIRIDSFGYPPLYGIEFSPDGSKLYVSQHQPSAQNPLGFLYQYDLNQKTSDAIKQSRVEIGTFKSAGALQLAPDGKIYFSQPWNTNLGAINKPNSPGLTCDYDPESIRFSGKDKGTGRDLPSFANTYFSKDFSHCKPHIPNAFSPDGDGVNDELKLVFNCYPSYYKLSIFNAWGEQVFQSNDPFENWDGHYQNKPVSSDHFIYVLKYNFGGKRIQSERGELYLLR